jgi:hypothetical protein
MLVTMRYVVLESEVLVIEYLETRDIKWAAYTEMLVTMRYVVLESEVLVDEYLEQKK